MNGPVPPPRRTGQGVGELEGMVSGLPSSWASGKASGEHLRKAVKHKEGFTDEAGVERKSIPGMGTARAKETGVGDL